MRRPSSDCHLVAVHQAIDQIEAELRRPIDLEDLARASRMSRWHFQHMFTAVVGEPVASYIRRRRLTSAARDLRRRRCNIVDVAFEYQFGSHEAFTRAFRSTFGTTPQAFRRDPIPLWSSRPRLTLEKLYRLRKMVLRPTFVDLPALHLVGLSTRFFGVNSDKVNNSAVIPDLWVKFRSRWNKSWPSAASQTFGAWDGLPRAERSEPDEFVYLASRSVQENVPVPSGMTTWSTPARLYARFTHRGPVSRVDDTIRHIYAAWLPRSGLRRAAGFDLELYDHRFHHEDEESQFYYYVPVLR